MTDGVKLINVDPNNTSMWVSQFSSTEAMNANFRTLLNNGNIFVGFPSDPVQITYNSGAANPLAITDDNSQAFNTDSGGLIDNSIYVWFTSNDPSDNRDVISNVMIIADTDGNLVGTTSNPNSNNSGGIIQVTNRLDVDNDKNIYYVYQQRPLNIVNQSDMDITAQVRGENSPTPNPANSTFPSSTDGTNISSPTAVVSANSNSNLPLSYPSQIYSSLIIWNSTNLSAGASPDYLLSFLGAEPSRSQNMNLTVDSSLKYDWNPDNVTLTISSSSTGTTPLPVGRPCTLDVQCLSGFCSPSSNTCRPGSERPKVPLGQPCTTTSQCETGLCLPPSTGGQKVCTDLSSIINGNNGNNGTNSNNGNGSNGDQDTDRGFPWWGWLIIGIVIIIIIFIIAVAIRSNSKSKSKNEEIRKLGNN